MWRDWAHLFAIGTQTPRPQIPAHWTLPLAWTHCAPSWFQVSAHPVPSAWDPQFFSPISSLSGKHLLIKAQLKHHLLWEAIQGPLHGERHFLLVPKSTRVLWPHCWWSTERGALEYIFAEWKDKRRSEQQPTLILSGASLVAQLVKNPSAMQEGWVRSLGLEDPLEKEMATHSGILAWRIPMDRGAWQATVHGVARVRHNLAIKPPPYPLQFFKSSLFSSRNPSMITLAHWSASLSLLYLFWPCCMASGILVSRPGIEPMSPTVEA